MSEVLIPTFAFQDPGLTEEEFQKKEAERGGPAKFFKPGNYTLRILRARLTKYASDPTWFVVEIILSQEGYEVVDAPAKSGKIIPKALDKSGTEVASVRHHLLVPTQGVQYTKYVDGRPAGKPTLFLFTKFREFMAALGEQVQCDQKSLQSIVPKYFTDLGKLKGREVTVDLGFAGPHLEFKSKDEVLVIDGKGEPVKDAEGNMVVCPSREAAEVEAASRGLLDKLERFVSVLKFHAVEGVEEVEATASASGDDW